MAPAIRASPDCIAGLGMYCSGNAKFARGKALASFKSYAYALTCMVPVASAIGWAMVGPAAAKSYTEDLAMPHSHVNQLACVVGELAELAPLVACEALSKASLVFMQSSHRCVAVHPEHTEAAHAMKPKLVRVIQNRMQGGDRTTQATLAAQDAGATFLRPRGQVVGTTTAPCPTARRRQGRQSPSASKACWSYLSRGASSQHMSASIHQSLKSALKFEQRAGTAKMDQDTLKATVNVVKELRSQVGLRYSIPPKWARRR